MYALIAMGRDRRALVAAYQYLILGTVGATFYVIGAGILFAQTGTLNLVDMAGKLEPVIDSRGGAGRARLHRWWARAQARALPAASVAAQRLCLRALGGDGLPRLDGDQGRGLRLRALMFSVYGVDAVLTDAAALNLVLLLAVVAMIAPSIVAVFQGNVKRLLAYSSVAQVGYIVLGIALLNQSGLTGGISHLFNHALIKGCLFLAVGCVVYVHGDHQGLGHGRARADHAAHHGRVRRRRARPDRGAGHGRVRLEMVSDPGRGRGRRCGGWCSPSSSPR